MAATSSAVETSLLPRTSKSIFLSSPPLLKCSLVNLSDWLLISCVIPSRFLVEKRFKAAIELINSVEGSRFQAILTRVIKSLYSKVCLLSTAVISLLLVFRSWSQKKHKQTQKKASKAFNDDEIAQLESITGATVIQVKEVVDSCSFIFEQAAFFNLKTEAFAQQLRVVGMNDNKVSPPLSSPLLPSSPS